MLVTQTKALCVIDVLVCISVKHIGSQSMSKDLKMFVAIIAGFQDCTYIIYISLIASNRKKKQ